ncbi:MAG: HAD hydrolase family protein, partial [Myxococcota bacterium]|nr:HAD hydrolase family protein [Myxococcota bacterium]
MTEPGSLDGILCDIDDTLTHEGRLVPGVLHALHRLQDAGLKVVPVTGRPGGWVDHVARMWPVDGV